MGIRLECPCGKVYLIADKYAGMETECAACGRAHAIPAVAGDTAAEGEEPPAQAPQGGDVSATDSGPVSGGGESICPFCRCPVLDGEPAMVCPGCKTGHHAECWTENTGCGIYGCEYVPATEKWESIDMPVSFWGQEKKLCPACGAEVLAAALRCRYCGAEFESGRPETGEEFQRREKLKRELPGIRNAAIWLFVLNVLTCSAPVAAIVGIVWSRRHGREIRELRPLHAALFKIGLCVGIGQTIVIAVMAILFAAFRA